MVAVLLTRGLLQVPTTRWSVVVSTRCGGGGGGWNVSRKGTAGTSVQPQRGLAAAVGQRQRQAQRLQGQEGQEPQLKSSRTSTATATLTGGGQHESILDLHYPHGIMKRKAQAHTQTQQSPSILFGDFPFPAGARWSSSSKSGTISSITSSIHRSDNAADDQTEDVSSSSSSDDDYDSDDSDDETFENSSSTSNGSTIGREPTKSRKDRDSSSSSRGGSSLRLRDYIAQQAACSRHEAERRIRAGTVTVAGTVITTPHYRLQSRDDYTGKNAAAIQYQGKPILYRNHDNYDYDNNNIDNPNLQNENDKKSGNKASTDTAAPVRVFLVHKLAGEVVTESDPHGRSSLMQRLQRTLIKSNHHSNNTNSNQLQQQQLQQQQHWKAIGRLDVMTTGLILVTNCGKYAREMELPQTAMHRTYRVRAHGLLTEHKLKCIRQGKVVVVARNNTQSSSTASTIADMDSNNNNNSNRRRRRNRRQEEQEQQQMQQQQQHHPKLAMRYPPMRVKIDFAASKQRRLRTSTNQWLTVTCTQGKNRQIRNVFQQLGLTVTRLIRVSFGDYQLQDLPPGMVLEVPVKPVAQQKHKGPLFSTSDNKNGTKTKKDEDAAASAIASPVKWIRPAVAARPFAR